MGMHKCENCGKEIHWKTKKERSIAFGWTGTLKSKWGEKYDRGSTAWWCTNPECTHQKEIACIQRFLPGASMATIEALLNAAELEKLREN